MCEFCSWYYLYCWMNSVDFYLYSWGIRYSKNFWFWARFSEEDFLDSHHEGVWKNSSNSNKLRLESFFFILTSFIGFDRKYRYYVLFKIFRREKVLICRFSILCACTEHTKCCELMFTHSVVSSEYLQMKRLTEIHLSSE